MTASLDSTCIVWDLSVLPQPSLRPTNPLGAGSSTASSSHQRVATIRLDAPVATAQFHPRTTLVVLATLTCNEIVLIDRRKGGGKWVLQDITEAEVGQAGDEDEAEGSQKKCVPSFLLWLMSYGQGAR